MRIIANYHIRYGKKTIRPGQEIDMDEETARHCIKGGSAVEVGKETKTTTGRDGRPYEQAELEKMSDGDLKTIADTLKVPGGKKEVVIKGILGAQKKGS